MEGWEGKGWIVILRKLPRVLKRKDFRHSDGLLLPRVAAVWLCLRGEACRHITEVRRAWETEL